MQKLNVNRTVHFLLFQDPKLKMIFSLALSLMNNFGSALMILNKKAHSWQLMDKKYHGRIGDQENQMVVPMRMRWKSGISSEYQMKTYGTMLLQARHLNSFVCSILKVNFASENNTRGRNFHCPCPPTSVPITKLFLIFYKFLYIELVCMVSIAIFKVIFVQVETRLRGSNSCSKWFNFMSLKLLDFKRSEVFETLAV